MPQGLFLPLGLQAQHSCHTWHLPCMSNLCSNLLSLFSETVFILTPLPPKLQGFVLLSFLSSTCFQKSSSPISHLKFNPLVTSFILSLHILTLSPLLYVVLVWFGLGSAGDWTWDLVHAGLLLCPWAIPLAPFSMEVNSYNVFILFSIYLDCFSDFRLKSKLQKGGILSGFLFDVIVFVTAF